MVILRPTRKLLKTLPCSAEGDFRSDTALGDWYVNRVVVDRKPLLILLSSRSLLPIVLPARDIKSLPERLPLLVARRLQRLGISGGLIDAEEAAMSPVHIARTTDRSVLGILVDFAKMLPFHVHNGDLSEASLAVVERRLAETPCYCGRRFEDTIFPANKAAELLAGIWHDRVNAMSD